MALSSSQPRADDITPSASRLTHSLRDIGYDFVAALADLVDNSISAGATKVDVELIFDGPRSYVLIADDGSGMSEGALTEALRFGTRRTYPPGALGRYGLGLKTASFSQCRRLTVVTRRSPIKRRLTSRTLDIDHVGATDRWEIIEPPVDSMYFRSMEWLAAAPGTVVLWENLDRILGSRRSDGGWARRRLDQLASRARDHLGMVFHRFLEGDASAPVPFTITVNGEKVRAWNPFAPDEEHRIELPDHAFEIAVGDVHGWVTLRRHVLPARDRFSSQTEFERMSGPKKWNRQQGLYLYRADRLIQSGGWCGLRAADEHTKLARAALDFPTSLDELFGINVAKMRVTLPQELRPQLDRPITELCHRAEAAYRREATSRQRPDPVAVPADAAAVGANIVAAALDLGEEAALGRIMTRLRELSPQSADALGWF